MGLSAAVGQTTYYVSPTGSDLGDGLSAATAWATVAKVNAQTLGAGDQVLFERGGQWRESLIVSQSGTQASPLVFGAYGTGARPTFWGSDVLPASGFAPLSGSTSTYEATVASPVNWVYGDGAFLRSSMMDTGGVGTPNTTLATNLNYVNSTAGSWYYDAGGGKVYVNTGGLDPRVGQTVLTAAVRSGESSAAVHVQGDNVIIRDVTVAETAHWNGGYGVRVEVAENVRLENITALRAGKHHFGAINANNLSAEGLVAAEGMPGMWAGAATAYVAYSDPSSGRDSSVWKNISVVDYPSYYPAFYTHGNKVGDITIEGLVTTGSGVYIPTEGTDQRITFIGGAITNAALEIGGGSAIAVVDGVLLDGSYLRVYANNSTVQNVLAVNANRADGVLYISGVDTLLRYNTVVAGSGGATAIAMGATAAGSTVLGNLVVGTDNAMKFELDPSLVTSDYNAFGQAPSFALPGGSVLTWEQWQAALRDVNGVAGGIQLAAGTYRLLASSNGVDLVPVGTLDAALDHDFDGAARPAGSGFDVGAFEVVPEPAMLVLAGQSVVLLGGLAWYRRRQKRKAAAKRGADASPDARHSRRRSG